MNVYEQIAKLSTKMERKLVKARQAMQREDEVRNKMLVAVPQTDVAKQISDLDFAFREILFGSESPEEKVKVLNTYVDKFDDELQGLIVWPPPRQKQEFVAAFLVNILQETKVIQSITSAISGGYVNDENDFMRRTVRHFRAGAGNLIYDEDKFIQQVNERLRVHNANNPDLEIRTLRKDLFKRGNQKYV